MKTSQRLCALGENRTRQIDFSRHEDNPSNRRGFLHRDISLYFSLMIFTKKKRTEGSDRASADKGCSTRGLSETEGGTSSGSGQQCAQPGCKSEERVWRCRVCVGEDRSNSDVTSSACKKRRDRGRQSFLLQGTGPSALANTKRKAGKDCTKLGWQSRNRNALSLFLPIS